VSAALKRARAAAREARARVVFPESDDPRVAEAMERLAGAGLAHPIGVAPPSSAQLAALMAARPVKEAIARRMLARPLIRAAAMVAAGETDVLVAGAASATRKVIEAASLAIGPAPGMATVSSFFLMVMADGRELIFADCALNVVPDAAALADIARASQASALALLGHSQVALLSYATGRSGAGESVEKMRHVAEITGFAGPVQGDAALNVAIARAKGSAGGDANTLIFPNLDAGNIAYKLVQELAGARAYGPVLQGFGRPVCDLSRGASVDDIVNATVLSIALGAG